MILRLRLDSEIQGLSCNFAEFHDLFCGFFKALEKILTVLSLMVDRPIKIGRKLEFIDICRIV